jgi:hypothetical protein
MIYWHYTFTSSYFYERLAESRRWYWENFDRDATHIVMNPKDVDNFMIPGVIMTADTYVKPGACLIGRQPA